MELDYNDISIAGIDAEAGCMLYDYETDVYLYILQAFVESVPASVEKLRDLSQETPKNTSMPYMALKVPLQLSVRRTCGKRLFLWKK